MASVTDTRLLQSEAAILRDHVQASPHDRTGAWASRAVELALAVEAACEPGPWDYLSRRLLRHAALLALAPGDDSAAVHLLACVQRIERIASEPALRDPKAAARLILAAFDGFPSGQLTRLLSVSDSTVRAWEHFRPGEQHRPRVLAVAELVTVLRDAMSPAGMLLWFETPRAELGDLSPIDVLDESLAAIAAERLVQSAAVPAVGACAIAPG